MGEMGSPGESRERGCKRNGDRYRERGERWKLRNNERELMAETKLGKRETEMGRRRQSGGRIGEGGTEEEGRQIGEGRQMGEEANGTGREMLGGIPSPHPKVLGKKPGARGQDGGSERKPEMTFSPSAKLL